MGIGYILTGCFYDKQTTIREGGPGEEEGVLNQIVCNLIPCRVKIFPCIATVGFSDYFPFSNEHDKVFKIF